MQPYRLDSAERGGQSIQSHLPLGESSVIGVFHREESGPVWRQAAGAYIHDPAAPVHFFFGDAVATRFRTSKPARKVAIRSEQSSYVLFANPSDTVPIFKGFVTTSWS